MGRPSPVDVDKQLNKAWESIEKGTTRWPGMTFEQGVADTISWMTGDSDEPPFGDDD